MRVFCCKQKTAYERRISDWSSDVCSSDLCAATLGRGALGSLRCLHGMGMYALQRKMPVRESHASGVTCEKQLHGRSDARRVGNECVSTCRSRWSPDH